MTGLEKITDRILAEARAQTDEIREKAEEEAGAVLRETEERLSRLREEAKEREALVKKELETRARSSASLKKRQLILAAKQDMIREQIEKAHQTLLAMEPEEYFSLIEQMVRRFALPKEGEICFSQRDLKRLPDQFEKRLEQAAAERGGKPENRQGAGFSGRRISLRLRRNRGKLFLPGASGGETGRMLRPDPEALV